MEIIYIIKILIRKAWIIVTIPIIAGLMAWFFTKDIEKTYQSTTQLSSGITTQNQIELSEESFNFWESKTKFSNLLETLKSELIVSMASYKTLIHDLEEEPFRFEITGLSIPDSTQYILEEKIEKFELLSNYNEKEKKIIDILKKMRYSSWFILEDLRIQRVKDTDFIRVSYASENPFLSSFITNTISEEFIRYTNYTIQSRSGLSVDFFTNLVNEKKNKLDEQISFLDQFKSSNQVYNYDLETEKNVTLLSGYEIELQEELKNKKGYEISLRDINTKINNYSKGNVTNNSKILDLRKKINELQRIYIDRGSDDKQLEESINNLREQLQIEMSKLAISDDQESNTSLDELITERDRLTLDLNIASSNISALRSTIANLRSDATQISSKESRLESLENNVKQASDEYLKAVDNLNDVKSKSLIGESAVKILIRAQPNEYPESSKALLIIALAIIASGGMCVATIILLEFFDMRLKTPFKFENLSGLKMAGSINRIKLSGLDLIRLFGEESTDKDLETYKHFLRKIRFEIEQSNSKVFLVTSTKQGEGKSFLILSLVYSLSLLNKRVLIIDTNFKHNSLTQLLMAEPNFKKLLDESTGLKLLTSPDVESSTYDKNIISNTNHNNIDIIGSTRVLSSPSEIFAGRSFDLMIDQLRMSYDYIFMEGASLNDFSDTKELVDYSDKILPIFSAKSSLNQIDKESIGYLKSLNGKLMGAILNNVDTKDIQI